MEMTNVAASLDEQVQAEIVSKESAELNALQLALVGGGFGDVTPI